MESVELVRRQFKRDEIEIVDELGSGLSLVRRESAQLQQIVINLIQNGRDALRGRTRRLDNRVTLSVEDDGPGITEHIRDKVFEPFFTTKETGKGSGLGLAAVFGIVSAHGGVIDLETEPGVGTTFLLTLPLD